MENKTWQMAILLRQLHPDNLMLIISTFEDNSNVEIQMSTIDEIQLFNSIGPSKAKTYWKY